MTAPATEAPARARGGRLRLFAVLAGLYVSQAIPSYLFAAAIPPIMRESGVSRSAIGYFSLLFRSRPLRPRGQRDTEGRPPR